MKSEEKHESRLPLLMRFSVSRTGEYNMPGSYDPEQQVWVTDSGSGPKPIVEELTGIAELITKTEAKPERDDQNINGLLPLLNLLTKTKVQQERDD